MPYEFRNGQGDVYLVVCYDEENNWLYNRWIGYATEREIKDGAERFFYTLRNQPIRQVLNDNREQTGPWIGVNEWLETVWMPKAAAAGLRQFAHVLSPGIFGTLSAQDMQRRTIPYFEMKLFGDIDNARSWLRSRQVVNKLPPENCTQFGRL